MVSPQLQMAGGSEKSQDLPEGSLSRGMSSPKGLRLGREGWRVQRFPKGKGLWWRRCSLSIVKVLSPPQIPPPGCPYATSYRTQVVCACSETSAVFPK